MATEYFSNYTLMPNSKFDDSIPCESCSPYCDDSNMGAVYCNKHGIEMGLHTGQHFCLIHNTFHCHTHWKECCKDFGTSVMTRNRTTTLQIQQRAEQIQKDLEEELHKYEIWVEQIKHARFICAECRSVACTCTISDWKEFEQHRKRKAKEIERKMKARDLEVV